MRQDCDVVARYAVHLKCLSGVVQNRGVHQAANDLSLYPYVDISCECMTGLCDAKSVRPSDRSLQLETHTPTSCSGLLAAENMLDARSLTVICESRSEPSGFPTQFAFLNLFPPTARLLVLVYRKSMPSTNLRGLDSRTGHGRGFWNSHSCLEPGRFDHQSCEIHSRGQGWPGFGRQGA